MVANLMPTKAEPESNLFWYDFTGCALYESVLLGHLSVLLGHLYAKVSPLFVNSPQPKILFRMHLLEGFEGVVSSQKNFERLP